MKKKYFKNSVIFMALGITAVSVFLGGCGSGKDVNTQTEATPAVVETGSSLDENTKSILERLIKEEALVNTVATDDKTDVKEIIVDDVENTQSDSEKTTVTATAHVVTEYFTDGSFVTHKTYRAENAKEDSEEVLLHIPKKDNIVRLSDGVHEVVQREVAPNTNNEESTDTTQAINTQDEEKSFDSGKYDKDKVVVKSEIIPEDKIEYEEVVVSKKDYDDTVKTVVSRDKTFVENYKDDDKKIDAAVEKTVSKVNETTATTVKEEAKQEDKKEDKKDDNKVDSTDEKNKETVVASQNTNRNNNSDNSASNKNTNTTNNQTKKNETKTTQPATPKATQPTTQPQTTKAKETVHQHSWENIIEKEPHYKYIEMWRAYDANTGNTLKTFDSESECHNWCEANCKAYFEKTGSIINYSTTQGRTETTYTDKVVGRKCKTCGKVERY